MQSFETLALTRESCRSFDPARPVAKEDLRAIIETAKLAPSASNRQHWRFYVCTGTTAKAVAEACKLIPGNNLWAEDCPAFIVISSVVRESRIGSNPPHDFPSVDVGIVTGYLCLAAAEKGISSCIVGSADEPGLKALLDVPEERRVHIVVALGYNTAAPAMKKDRLSYEELAVEKD